MLVLVLLVVHKYAPVYSCSILISIIIVTIGNIVVVTNGIIGVPQVCVILVLFLSVSLLWLLSILLLLSSLLFRSCQSCRSTQVWPTHDVH